MSGIIPRQTQTLRPTERVRVTASPAETRLRRETPGAMGMAIVAGCRIHTYNIYISYRYIHLPWDTNSKGFELIIVIIYQYNFTNVHVIFHHYFIREYFIIISYENII